MQFDNHDSRIKYYELLLKRDDLEGLPRYELPEGYRFVFYEQGDRDAWIATLQSAKEFDTYEQGLEAWNRYYEGKDEELKTRMVFVVNEAEEKVATATAYYDICGRDKSGAGWLHWVAVRRDEQGKGLSKPMIAYVLDVMRSLGYTHAKIPTQTTTWLACKVYLDLGFVPVPENAVRNKRGWQIIKTLTNHPTLAALEVVEEEQMLSIKGLTEDKAYTVDEIGMSGNQVHLYEDMVLKIETQSEYVEQQVRIMEWLAGKLPVPRILGYEINEGKSYLLMSRIQGEMSCAEYYLEHPHVLLEALAEGLRMLWNVDITDCPNVRDLDAELVEARKRVENGLVNMENAEPGTFGEEGFESPAQLLKWLEENRPIYEPVFSHGDFCLPNVFLQDGQVSGFIDLGDAGVGDKWRDIALCYRSLKHNFDGTFDGKVYEDFEPDMLFEKLGIEPDREKLRYYILLDELF